jgi:hypothetical protein
MENSGSFGNTLTMALDPTHTYMVEGFLTKKNGGDYAHVYIAEVCTQVSPDQIDCGIRNEGSSGIVAVLSHATEVTIGLQTSGGNHRAEGIIWQL